MLWSVHLKRAEFQHSPNFGDLLYLCVHPLTQNDRIRHINTYNEGHFLFLGQPCRCVCTNTSRGLSVIAEFPVVLVALNTCTK